MDDGFGIWVLYDLLERKEVLLREMVYCKIIRGLVDVKMKVNLLLFMN